MMQIPCKERPRERLLREGIDALSNREVLAIILGNGTKGFSVLDLADELLKRFGGLERLLEASIEELIQIRGMGQAKAIQIKAAFSLAKRAMVMKRNEWSVISNAEAAFRALEDLFLEKTKEVLAVLLLDTKLRAFQREVVAVGTLTDVLVHPREVFLPAIRHRAHSIIIAHNHPSGDLASSDADICLTDRLQACAEILDIPLLDHLIIGRGEFISLKEVVMQEREGIFCQTRD